MIVLGKAGKYARERGRERQRRRDKERECVGLEWWTYEQTASIYLLLEYRWAGLHY